MSILRTAVVVGLAIAMMPSDKAQQAALYDKAAAAVAWTATFCDRKPATCAQAHAGWEAFKAKAQFAGGLAYDAALAYLADRQVATAMTDGEPQQEAPFYPEAQRGNGTLTQDDLGPSWRGMATASTR